MTPQEFFKKDLFAEQTGVELLEVREGYSKARLVITENHLNAGHRTQGGAIFTLADLALAAAANSHGTLAFSNFFKSICKLKGDFFGISSIFFTLSITGLLLNQV